MKREYYLKHRDERNDQLNACFYKYACGLVAAFVSAIMLSGCSVVDSFKPEVIRIDDGEITIKGWIDAKKSLFCIKIELKKQAETVTLHSLNVVRPDGTKAAPHEWKDQTPRKAPPRLSLGFGVGLGGLGGHHGEGFDHGPEHGTVLKPGFSVPLQREKSNRSVTKVAACWKIEALKSNDVSQCNLEVNLSRISQDKISLTTLTLAMTHHEDEKKTVPPPEDNKQTAKDLIGEIDFTQKGPVKTKHLDV